MRLFSEDTIKTVATHKEAYIKEIGEMLPDTTLEDLDLIWVLLKKIRGEQTDYEC